MDKVKGVKDFMERERFAPRHISKALIEKNVPGNWDSYMNIYNLVNGISVPRDAYVYIVLSDILNVDLKTVLYRYSEIMPTSAFEKLKLTDQSQSNSVDWDDVF